jgi:hypothetical protein
LLARFLFRPVAKNIADRQDAASALIAEAAGAKAAAEEAQQRAADAEARIEAERAKRFDAVAAEADALKAALERDALADVAALGCGRKPTSTPPARQPAERMPTVPLRSRSRSPRACSSVSIRLRESPDSSKASRGRSPIFPRPCANTSAARTRRCN